MNEAVSKKEQELAAKQQELEKELETIRASLAAAQAERDEVVTSIGSKEAQWKQARPPLGPPGAVYESMTLCLFFFFLLNSTGERWCSGCSDCRAQVTT